MRETFLTRADEVGSGPFDSIAWAFEVHVNRADMPEVQCAILYGNEDAPERIEFYVENHYQAAPVYVWRSE